ncbi:ATP-binding protein [Phytoactinopolyspora halotolerans]|uniref:ATP-binding protein n=1 Tax=Phytoactinopolyspora halotolerans TaxID=1981512 RepID=A0A6L9S7B2_9ACTN|nr:ATP-binding protein [Phytoactinopolyspora halotolerans]NEE01066.1 ATP-binding protein [Phytoactinopolyspora halotolerans]
MHTSDTLIDRDKEIARLHRLLARSEPQLVLMYGRRRVGKTYLLNRAWDSVGASTFYFTASETTAAQNRAALLDTYAAWSGEQVHPEDYPTWRSVFRLLLGHVSTQPLVITIDEFQYLGEDHRDLNAVASELNAAWEMRRPPRPLLFILAGSAVRTLESLNDGGSPLYGRFAWQTRLRPFDYWHAGELASFDDVRDRARAYGIFGGTPRYLAPVDATKHLAENVIDLVLEPTGEVRELVQTALLQEQGLRDISKYVAILRAIGGGRTNFNEIAQRAGVDADSSLREKIERLIELDYVRAGRRLGAKPKEPYRYDVSDPAMRFYYDAIAPIESMLATQNPRAIWEQRVAPMLDGYMGLIFEGMVEEAYYRLADVLGLPLVREWGRWEGVDRQRTSLEMDIACPLLDDRVLTGAIKWNTKPVDVDVHSKHLGMLDRLVDAGIGWAHDANRPDSPLLYVAAGGFTDRFRQAATASRDEVYLWTIDDLYQPHEKEGTATATG